jgi:predicted acyltransferase
MIFGLLAGELLRGPSSAAGKLQRLLVYGAAGIALGAVLHVAGIAPLVKRIWTPSWAVFSAGWAAVFLALFYHVVDVRGWRRWTLPFLVVGMNSIAMYVIVHVAEGFLRDAFRTHLGRDTLQAFGAAYEPVVVGALSLLVFWFMLYWMYRRRIFIRI